jgi:hypothetical protein
VDLNKENTMNTTKNIICMLATAASLCAAAPVFADSWHGRGYESHDRYRSYNTHEMRGHERFGYRHEVGRRVVVIERPYVVQQRAYVVQPPVYYNNPPLINYGPAAVLGAAIGGYIDQQH